MYNLKNNKGFTLAELLIVIAIIAALVAIMIPTFSGQIEKAREAADYANLRAAYAEVTNKFLEDAEDTELTKNVPATQTQADWQSGDGKVADITVTAQTKGSSWDVTFVKTNNKVTITAHSGS
ncbi:MAG: prepilin-type N-terminal cleavage/methylation domain-containing protein [Oscillospiraceae bacterium]|nr:prepilin-type N-terminal cleavage/methylation domain-containing protein [Oscillospiraceae bacterium]